MLLQVEKPSHACLDIFCVHITSNIWLLKSRYYKTIDYMWRAVDGEDHRIPCNTKHQQKLFIRLNMKTILNISRKF